MEWKLHLSYCQNELCKGGKSCDHFLKPVKYSSMYIYKTSNKILELISVPNEKNKLVKKFRRWTYLYHY